MNTSSLWIKKSAYLGVESALFLFRIYIYFLSEVYILFTNTYQYYTVYET